jgi:glycosyltransferase involved in cell wall biosynthesis
MKISILIPVYNEANTIEELIMKVLAVDLGGAEREIIIVDDCSQDGTRELLKKYEYGAPDIKVFFHNVNQGKGAAIRTGQGKITGDVVIIQDADLEYNPEEYPNLLKPILEGKADVVYGSRFTSGTHRVLFFWHYLGNKVLTTLSNMFTNLNLTDMETCYKVFKADLFKGIELKSDRFGFEPEITAKIAKKKCVIYEIGVSYFGRDYSEGKKIGWKDGLSAIYCILRFNLFR